ncbi:nuclear transport factor 2 family protein [Hymenobacter cellulosivorans]|uniref:Nuclear transport factor 2 family protein n=1 Tax=Hymenobacter cellulosivorans TaxID=2932249 RepID=A0ABY4FCM9_9BACT|nr:nuclear transport factor 2 family protein [Hymenobacter cellulosivorans]UOQ52226.1 nuclear transport factor 2 family protein [Hymenobacter cellulosivorans]
MTENNLTITKAVTDIFVGADERDWARVKRSFASQVLLDYTSLAGGQPTMLTPDQILAAWQGVLPGFVHTHHQLGNFEVQELSAQEATAFCYGTATHYLPQPSGGNIWTVVGTYTAHLLRLGTEWQVDQLKFTLKYQDGNLTLPGLAAEQVKNGAAGA